MRVEASVDRRDGTMRLLVQVACTSLALWLALTEFALAQSDSAAEGRGQCGHGASASPLPAAPPGGCGGSAIASCRS